MTNFYKVITATEKKDLDSIEFPCTVIVGEATKEAREEAVDLVFKEIRRRYIISFRKDIMEKIKHITRNDIPDDNTGMIINELIDAINKLQEHRESQAKENSLVYEEIEKLKSCLETPAVDNHTIDSLLLQVSQHQEAIDDMQNTIAKLNQYESDNFVARHNTEALYDAKRTDI